MSNLSSPSPAQLRAARWQRLLPRHLLTRCAGYLAAKRAGKATTWAIRRFVQHYNVNMDEAQIPDLAHYTTFNELFVRALKPECRPVSEATLISPVDGVISQLGRIQETTIIQAKQHHYTTQALLASDTTLADKFTNGLFATIYLSPKDYHRIHMPCAGTLISMRYVPGDLYSVNPATVIEIPGLFARNERVICHFKSETLGDFVMILAGATIVGSMQTAWHGIVNKKQRKQTFTRHYDSEPIQLRQGEEMGQFLLGSTVIVLFQHQTLAFEPSLAAGSPVKLGEAFGNTGELP